MIPSNETGAPSRYTFSEASPEWPAAFRREAERWRSLLGDELVTVHHIGSTSVPGLAAKSVIDLLPLVRAIERIDERTSMLVVAGYKAWGEYGLARRRFFTKDREGRRTHNIHIYKTDDPDVERHLALCAYLREHRQVCVEYEALKREAYARYPADIGAYNDYKDAWIKRMEPVAIEWRRRRLREGGAG